MLTKRNKEVLTFIHDFRESNGFAPTIQEIANGVGLKSTSSAMRHVERLIDAECINHIPSSPRTISLTQQGLDLILQNNTSNSC